MLKIRKDDNTKERWIDCSEAVFHYAKKSLKSETEVELTLKQVDKKDFIERIVVSCKSPEPVATPKTETVAASAPVTETKATPPAPKPEYKKSYAKSPEEQDKIIRQCAMKSAVEGISRVMAGKGFNSPEDVKDYLDAVEGAYFRILDLITK